VIFQNPWNPVNTALAPLNNQYSLPPNNQAGSVNVMGGVGLPWNSRYMGTFQYTKMTSDASGLPFSINPPVQAAVGGYSTPSRETSTTLFNNVLNTQITSNLTSTLKYRYYSYNAEPNPALVFPPRPGNPDSLLGTPDDELEIRYPTSYTKQNADAEVVYRPQKWLNLGAIYDWERWERSFRNVDTTNENTGKVFLDAKSGFSQLRASLQYGVRRNDGYINFDGANTVDQYRMKDLADRDRTKGAIQWAVDVTEWLTVTPNGGFLTDDYQTNVTFGPGSELGLKHANSWNAGIDGTLNISRDLAFFVAYNYERGYRQVFENASPPKANVESTDFDNTIIVGAKYTAIPHRLFFNANFTWTQATSQWNLGCTAAGCQYTPLAVYPDIHNTLTRLDLQAKYVFDDSFSRNWGLLAKAHPYVKARVAWERNSNDSWQPLQQQLGFLVNPTVSTTGYSIWLATGNPNYDVVLAELSFGVKW
jgi:MtrB/PioB family decaheme-associated outer membrane protein